MSKLAEEQLKAYWKWHFAGEGRRDVEQAYIDQREVEALALRLKATEVAEALRLAIFSADEDCQESLIGLHMLITYLIAAERARHAAQVDRWAEGPIPKRRVKQSERSPKERARDRRNGLIYGRAKRLCSQINENAAIEFKEILES